MDSLRKWHYAMGSDSLGTTQDFCKEITPENVYKVRNRNESQMEENAFINWTNLRFVGIGKENGRTYVTFAFELQTATQYGIQMILSQRSIHEFLL